MLWSLMADAESPATLFELLITRVPRGQFMRVIYDNACNAQHFFLNREAEMCKFFEFFVDELHWSGGHPHCSKAYNTGRRLTIIDAV